MVIKPLLIENTNHSTMVDVKPTEDINTKLISEFLKFLDTKPSTIQTYANALKQFMKWKNKKSITNLTRDNILDYRDYLRANYKATTIQGYIVALKRFFLWTGQAKLHPNITENIKGARISVGYKKDYLPADAIKTVLTKIPQLDVIGRRDFALLSLMVKCGLRVCEVVRANVEDLRNGRLYIQGKGKDEKSEFVKIPQLVETALRNYLVEIKVKNKECMPLFVCLSNRNNKQQGRMTKRSISRIVKERFKKAGYDSERLTAHSLRHSAITLSLLSGATIQQAQQLARHTNINTTMIYAHNLTAENNPCVDLVEQSIGI